MTVLASAILGAYAVPTAGVPQFPSTFYDPRDMQFAGGAKFDGATDDTSAILAAVNAAGEAGGGVVLLPAGKTSLVVADALSWNYHNVVLRSDGLGAGLGAGARPCTLKFATGGVYGIKIGAAANYASTLRFGNAIEGVRLDFNAQPFTDAALVLEGVTKFALEKSMLYNSGAASRMMRLKCVWDSDFLRNYIHTLTNPGAALIDLDAYQTDAAGNNNNLRWLNNHFEDFDGALFYSRASGNLDGCQWYFNKFEAGTVPTGSPTANFVFDLRSCDLCEIEKNSFNQFTTAKWGGLVRFGDSADAYLCTFKENTISAFDAGVEAVFGANARVCTVKENRHYNSTGNMTATMLSAYTNYYSKPITTVSAEHFDQNQWHYQQGGGWTAATAMRPGTSNTIIPDIASISANEQGSGGTVIRQTSVNPGDNIFNLPRGKLRDSPLDCTLYVRARRTKDGGTAALRLDLNGVSIAGSAFAALPAAVASVSFDGNGTTVTATKVAHGFKVGDRIIVTGTTNYNTTASQPVQILTVPTADSFTYASTVNQAAESGSAQKCQWQNIAFTVQSTDLAGLTGTETVRIKYGTSNDQAIDVDAYMVVFHPAALHS